MKNFNSLMYLIFTALIVKLSACKIANKQQTELLYTNVEIMTYVIDQDTFKNQWTVMPKVNPDVLTVECDQKPRVVTFISNCDTASFTINLHDTIRFSVLFDKDTARTIIVGIPRNVNFSDEYIRLHNGKHEVDIPEVHELANILVAISKVGQIDSNMVNMTTPYYTAVLNYFMPFASHPIIDSLNKKIVAKNDEMSYWCYYALKMNACAYVFDEHDQIVNKGIIRRMGFQNAANPFEKWSIQIADFALKSNFRTFYKQHQSYYDSLKNTYKILNPIEKMQNWLEHKFGFGYGNYTVYFSPLVGGAHATQQFEDNGFKQTVMFVSMAEVSPLHNMNVSEMLESRVVFTEIDHNFVNLVSDTFIKDINKVFAQREKWVRKGFGTDAYNNPYAVFNEYMTWAYFSLYCIDNFPEKDVKQMIDKMEKQMVKGRNFIKFDVFNQELIKQYKANPSIKPRQLYEAMLQWAAKQ
jgi:hypothetical protein